MPDHTDNTNLDKIVFEDRNVEGRLWSSLRQTCSRFLIVSLSQFFVVLVAICGSFWLIQLAKTCDESTVRVGILCSAKDTFYLDQNCEQGNFYKNRIFISLVGPSVSGKTHLIQEWLKVETFQLKSDKICFFYQHPPTVYNVEEKLIILNLFKVYTLNLSNLWKIKVTSICSFLVTHVQKFATLRSLWTLSELANIADLVQYTLNTSYSTKIN